MIYIYDGFMMHVLDTRRCTGEVSKLVWEGVIKEEKRGGHSSQRKQFVHRQESVKKPVWFRENFINVSVVRAWEHWQ